MGESLRSLMSKEAPWANCSGCSWLMRDREWFAQVVHDKWANRSFFWANLSFALSLTKNEQFAPKNLTIIVFFGTFFLTSDLLIPSFLMSYVSKSLRWLTKNEWCEQIAQVAHQKWATISKSLRSFTKNERTSKSLVFLSELLIQSFFPYSPWLI